MIEKSRILLFVLSGIVSISIGCASAEEPGPEYAPSAGFSGYAVEYPPRLEGLTDKFKELGDEARKSFADFDTYPGELKEPDWDQVLTVYERSYEYGRTSAYGEAALADKRVEEFFEDGKDEVARRINGAVKSAADKDLCTCEIDAYGKIAFALKDSVEKHRARRLRARSAAHQLLERYGNSLGKRNVDELEDQADAILRASHIVFVALWNIKGELDRRLEEVKDVNRTIENALEAEEQFLAHPEIKKKDKADCEERIARLREAQGKMTMAVERAEELSEKAEQEIAAIQEEYEDAMERLRRAVEQKRGLEGEGGA